MSAIDELPYGYTSFREIRREGKLYVDKTDIVHRLAHSTKYNFLSRPRRFGKSILVDTLESYWLGERDLFAGLKMAQLESSWEAWPVIRLDMSRCQNTLALALRYLADRMSHYERQAGLSDLCEDPDVGFRFGRVLEGLHVATGKTVVLLVDEYDYLLQNTWGTPEYEPCAALYRNFFGFVKSCGEHLKWVFVTGIARFSGVALMSAMNNVGNISLRPEYSELCGFTEADVRGPLWPALCERAAQLGLDPEELLRQYKRDFDGYRFAVDAPRHVFNCYCLIGALRSKAIRDPLGSSATSNFLRKFVQADRLRVASFDHVEVPRGIVEAADVVTGIPELYFYLLGYLTIEACHGDCYTLCYPSAFIRQTLYDLVLPALLMCDAHVIRTTQQSLLGYLRLGNVDAALCDLRALVERAPFDNNDKLVYKHEAHYQLILQSIFGGLGVLARLEYLTHRGRADLVVDVGEYVYVFELKMDAAKSGGLDAAASQLLSRGYHRALLEHGRRVKAVALAFDHTGEGLAEWREVEV